MSALLPVDKGASVPTPQDNRESAEERAARYEGIAEALDDVVYSDAEEPLFLGEDGRAKTAALLLSISFWESGGWNKVVDLGIGKRAAGDSGTSHCLAQVRLSPGAKTRDGYTAKDLVADRRACFRAALNLARDSFRSCGRTPLPTRLAVYTSGRCDAGISESRRRIATAERIYAQTPPPADDGSFVHGSRISLGGLAEGL